MSLSSSENGKMKTLLEWISPDCYISMTNVVGKDFSITSLYEVIHEDKSIKLGECEIVSNYTYKFHQADVCLGGNKVYFVLDNYKFEISCFNLIDWSIEGKIEIDQYPSDLYSKDELKTIKERLTKLNKKNAFMQKLKVQLPERKPVIKNIFADSNDFLYIVTNRIKGEMAVVEVYDNNLKLKGNLLLPESDIFCVEDGHYYIIKEINSSYYLSVFKIFLK